MTIGELLTPDRVFLDLRASDKRRLIDDLARRAAGAAGVDASVIAEALNAREQLGSTGMGAGIAIPHARLPTLQRPLGFFVRLRAPMDFDAIDGDRVDLVFVLLLPAQAQGEHLNALACVARRLRAEPVTIALRKAQDVADLYAVLTDRGGS
ncbi:MAG: PTS sugar transporter subunit IIA [Janthinobacterium lividum]